ncbi:MAG: aryl-sulfate sulfotransferase [Bacteroidota bacterium]
MRSAVFLCLSLLLLMACQSDSSKMEQAINISDNQNLIANVKLILNPCGIAPLTALFKLEDNKTVTVQLEVGGAIPVTYSTTEPKRKWEIPVLGLYPDTLNTLTLVLTSENGSSFSLTEEVTTPPLPDFFPSVKTEWALPEQMEPGFNLCELSFANHGNFISYPMMTDHRGAIRWYLYLSDKEGIAFAFQRIKNGNYLFIRQDEIVQINPLGQITWQATFPKHNFHHDIIVLPNGHFVAICDIEGTEIQKGGKTIPSIDDQIVEIDPMSKTIVNRWDMRDILDVDRIEVLDGKGDWIHLNSMAYDASDRSLIISGRNQAILKVNLKNELQWIMAPHKNWGQAGMDGQGLATPVIKNCSSSPFPSRT